MDARQNTTDRMCGRMNRFVATSGRPLIAPTRSKLMVYGQTDCFGVIVACAGRSGPGMTPLDYTAQHEGEAIARLMFLVPRSKRVIHASILWNKNRYRSWVQAANHRTAFARAMFGEFFNRRKLRGRKYRQSMKSMGRCTRDR